MFDPNQYNSQPELKGSHESDSWATRSGFAGFVRMIISQSLLWAAMKYSILLVLVVTSAYFGLDWKHEAIDEVANHVTSSGYGAALKKIESSGMLNKSTRLNMHPIYSTSSAEGFLESTGQNMRDIYQYAKLDGRDILVMKGVWYEDGIPLEVEYSNFIMTDAKGYCEQHDAYIATEAEVKAARVARMEGEGFAINEDSGWRGDRMFRCTVDLGGAE